MKKRTIVLLALLGLTAILEACNLVSHGRERGNVPNTTQQTTVNKDSLPSNSESYIGETKALEIALGHAGVNASSPLYFNAKLDFDDGRATYDVEFYADNKEYDYTVDAVNGNVLGFDADMEFDFIPSKTQQEQIKQQQANNENYIGETKALEIALSDSGVNASSLLYSNAKFDFDDGRATYEVEFYADNKEYDYTIDAVSGNILGFDTDMEFDFIPSKTQQQTKQESSKQQAQQQQASQNVGLEQAKQIALSKVPGATADHIRIKEDYDDRRLVYEGKIIYNNTEYEFEIDAASGNVTDWDAESIYD